MDNRNWALQIIKNNNEYAIKDIITVARVNFYEPNDIPNFNYILAFNLETDPAYRCQGYATVLLNELYKDAQSCNKGIYLLVEKSNKAAYNLYKKLGFNEVKGAYINDDKYICFAKGGNQEQFKDIRL